MQDFLLLSFAAGFLGEVERHAMQERREVYPDALSGNQSREDVAYRVRWDQIGVVNFVVLFPTSHQMPQRRKLRHLRQIPSEMRRQEQVGPPQHLVHRSNDCFYSERQGGIGD